MPRAWTFCPSCGQKMNIRVESIDTVRKCPACSEKFIPRLRAEEKGTGCLVKLVTAAIIIAAAVYGYHRLHP